MQNEKEAPKKKKNGQAVEPIEMLNAQADELRERLAGIDTQLRTAARQRPIAVVCGALLVGYIFGRIVSR